MTMSSRSPARRPCSALDGNRVAETHPEVFPDVRFTPLVVGLVAHHDDGRAGAAYPVGDELIVIGQADRRVDHEQHDIGLLDGCFHLPADLRVERIATRHPAAGVYDEERDVEPLGLEFLAVAGDTRLVLDDGLLAPDDAVEQRALADVRTADDDDSRQIRGGIVRDRRRGKVADGVGDRDPSGRRAVGGCRSSDLQCGSQRDAVGGDDLDRTGQITDGHPVEEPAVVGQAHVGKQVAVPVRLAGEHAA